MTVAGADEQEVTQDGGLLPYRRRAASLRLMTELLADMYEDTDAAGEPRTVRRDLS